MKKILLIILSCFFLLESPHVQAYVSTKTQELSLSLNPIESNYVMQETDSSCSLASTTVVLNTIKMLSEPNFNPISQSKLLEQTNDDSWAKAVAEGGDGISLDEMAGKLKKSMNAFHINNVTIKAFHVNKQNQHTKNLIHKYLKKIANEAHPKTFIIANFEQSIFIPTNEPVGHFSPIGAYKPGSSEVYVLDVDKDSGGPYWVTEKTFVDGLNTMTSDGTYRGFIVIEIND